MMHFNLADGRPGLLVSVRGAGEALEALAGGADVIDVKEPKRGSLGAADAPTIAEVVRAVNGRATVTAALGELMELGSRRASDNKCGMPSPRGGVGMLVANHAHPAEPREHATLVPAGVSLFKIGLAGCRANPDWICAWLAAIAPALANGRASASRPVAVVYADWEAANAPAPIEVLNAEIQIRCPALLVDTWDKSSGSLFDHWPATELRSFIDEVRSRGIRVVLAGSLSGAAVGEAARLEPDLVAVRTAACDGGRDGTVSRERVRALKRCIAAVRAS
ncbi:MAG TPA: (5-formylfuran-3-yl)methyl phosphate synthase [Lacipirellulaceae bacterium]